MKQGWEIKKLGDVCELITKGTTPTSLGFHFTDEGVNFIKVESLTESGQIIPKKVAYISEDCHESLKRSQLKVNDILFSIAGALGRIGIVNKEIVPANTNQALAIIRLANDSGILVSFLAKYFTSNKIVEEIENLKGGAAQQNLSLGQLNNLSISIPPLPEQQNIVAILDEAFTAINKAKANAQQNLKNAKELFESYFQNIFEKKGQDWIDTCLKSEIELITGFAFKSKNYTELDDDIVLLRGDNIMQGNFRWDDVKRWKKSEYDDFKKYQLKEHDIVLAMDRPWVKAGLKCARLSKFDLPALLLQRTACLRNKSKIDNTFLYYLVKSKGFMNHLLEVQTGIGVPHISGQQILSFCFFKPPLLQQQTIVQKLDALNKETKKLEAIYQQKINDLEELKKSILQKAFAGELKTTKELV
ncbi:restriction endonuclease subunit S [Flavobacterium sp. FZUC8N2.13]|uniref:Restriction endonuclease subunit S n=1 Tax=Flavobacterium zubiriense TaxID=3138075 RepID=A0ABV4T8Z0_9FLAO